MHGRKECLTAHDTLHYVGTSRRLMIFNPYKQTSHVSELGLDVVGSSWKGCELAPCQSMGSDVDVLSTILLISCRKGSIRNGIDVHSNFADPIMLEVCGYN
jgi:hypothetical protein